MTVQRAMQADRPDQYERLGVTKEILPFEDGLRTDPHEKGAFEWWYFDANLSDGAKLVVVFYTKNATAPNVGLEPTVSIDLDLPDGRMIHKRSKLPAAQFRAAKERCDVRIGDNRFTGDLHTYSIQATVEDVRVDVTLTGSAAPWRPGTGYMVFGDDESDYFAWLPSVPQGHVAATYTVADVTATVTGTGYHDHNWGNVPMASILDNWYWGRGSIGPYTFISAYIVTEKKYGFAAVPQFMLARDGKVVADDGAKVTFTKQQIADDQPTGKPVADITTYDYRDGSSRYVLIYTREKTILRQRFIEALRGIQRLAAHLIGFNGAYLRFSGKLELRHYEGGELTETYSAPALWELMYFGKVDHDQH
jgi:predicted secreted hydrolase